MRVTASASRPSPSTGTSSTPSGSWSSPSSTSLGANPETGMTEIEHHQSGPEHGESVHLPQPTHWPIVLAFGFTGLCGGLVINGWVSLFGAVLVLAGCIGWFRQVLPHEAIEHIPVRVQPVTVETSRRSVERLSIGADQRVHLPVETYPVRSGIKGGIAGGFAMIIPAEIYGLIAQHSIWYPVNLL